MRPRFIGPFPLSVFLAVLGAGLAIFLTVGWVGVTTVQREAIHTAAREGDAARIESILARHPEWIENRNRLDLTPLLNAAWHGKVDAMEVLLRYKADTQATWGLPASGDGDWNGLHVAANFGQPEAAALLLKAGTNPNALTRKGETPLDVAVRTGSDRVAAVLRSQGAKTGADLRLEAQPGSPQRAK